jgi:hypothetical protein
MFDFGIIDYERCDTQLYPYWLELEPEEYDGFSITGHLGLDGRFYRDE